LILPIRENPPPTPTLPSRAMVRRGCRPRADSGL